MISFNRFWLFEPRCGMHDIGGWYVETFGRDRKGRIIPSRRYWDGFDVDEQFDGKFVPCKPQKIQAFTVPPGLAHLSIIIGNVLLIHMLVLLGLINMCFQAVINNYTSSYHALPVFDTVES